MAAPAIQETESSTTELSPESSTSKELQGTTTEEPQSTTTTEKPAIVEKLIRLVREVDQQPMAIVKKVPQLLKV
uniref:Uncharacterized protein n=1 Tax=Acrobeloides nanus TaxID=290746 RepID=A0A914CW62_9BILA